MEIREEKLYVIEYNGSKYRFESKEQAEVLLSQINNSSKFEDFIEFLLEATALQGYNMESKYPRLLAKFMIANKTKLIEHLTNLE